MKYEKKLGAFQKSKNIISKGALAIVIQLTADVQTKKFPLNPESFKTPKGGQVAGLSGKKLQKILQRYGIKQSLASEAGRTSRGSIQLMTDYLNFLNEWHSNETIDFDKVELFWAEQIKKFFQSKPLTLSANNSKTISANLNELFQQAKNRQEHNTGTQYMGTILQHLVAAKLKVIMPNVPFEIHGASVADSPTNRDGDFEINDTIIHCTTSPTEALLNKCADNIDAGKHPIIITLYDRVEVAQKQAEDKGLSDKIDVWSVQQFLSTNLCEHSLFKAANINDKMESIIKEYNNIVSEHETDPSLKINYLAKK